MYLFWIGCKLFESVGLGESCSSGVVTACFDAAEDVNVSFMVLDVNDSKVWD